MRPAEGLTLREFLGRAGRATLCLIVASSTQGAWAVNAQLCQQDRAVYLTFDTGHMGVAPLISQVLERQQVKATFFLANEKTQVSAERPAGSSLDDHWASWWQALAKQGHDIGSHTWNHAIWQADIGAVTDDVSQSRMSFRYTAGPKTGQRETLTAQQYCAELEQSAQRFKVMTGQSMRSIFRAPGGKTSPRLLQVARRCGWHHVPWTPAGFLGDELSSERYPNAALLQQAVKNVRAGDILLAHLGIWSRQDPWAPAVLEPLILGLKRKGLCFATMRSHPQYRDVGLRP
jgi:peptidoglycan-N-acetylmuramic acid deacetylase